MDKIRRGEIALRMIEKLSRDEGIKLTPNFRRDMGNKAKAIDVPIDEFMEFVEELVREQVEEIFKKPVRN